MSVRAIFLILGICVFGVSAHSQEMETFSVYGVEYSVPANHEDPVVMEEIAQLPERDQIAIRAWRRDTIIRYLRALTITSPIATFRERFSPPTADVWLDENRMLSEFGGYFSQRNPPIGTQFGKRATEFAMKKLNNHIWSTAKIKGKPDSYSGQVVLFFWNSGLGIGNKVTMGETEIPTSAFYLQGLAAYTFFDHSAGRRRTKFYYHRQLVDRSKSAQMFLGVEVGVRIMQVATSTPDLDATGEFLSLPGTPVAMRGSSMAGVGVNFSLNLLTDFVTGSTLWQIIKTRSLLGMSTGYAMATIATNFVSKFGLVQSNFENNYLFEWPTARDFWTWIEGTMGRSVVHAIDFTLPSGYKLEYLHGPKCGNVLSPSFRSSVFGLGGAF